QASISDPTQLGTSGHSSTWLGFDAMGLDSVTVMNAVEPALPPANDQSAMLPAVGHGAMAPATGMPSAEMLLAAAQPGATVERLVADAIGVEGDATVDEMLEALGDAGIGSGLSDWAPASPDVSFVPGWHMGSGGTSALGVEMMFRVDAALLHHDAVQPVVNG
ncbi:MAG TPA: hypothetical protein VNA29_09030, partial [Sphingomicrobium sp.]|nr:hypothetical protein [Sphingomicrobium sp.]